MKAVVVVVCCATSRSTPRVSRPRAAASMHARKAPIPDASVGVARPKKIEPSTPRISIAGGSTERNTRRISLASTFGASGGSGATLGRRFAMMKM